MKRAFLNLALSVAFSFFINACVEMNRSSDLLIAPPSPFSYTIPAVIYAKNSTITPNVPINNGAPIQGYSISPPLPQGLGIDPDTGVISGIPLTAQATTLFTVTGSNTSGTIEAQLLLTVISQTLYPSRTYSFQQESNVGPILPNNIGIPALFSGELPAGLILDPNTGAIHGVPSGVPEDSPYTITATTSVGVMTEVLSVAITLAPISTLTYASPNAVYNAGAAIVPNLPVTSGGTVQIYTVNPDLPYGMSLDPLSGQISGTPEFSQSSTAYTVTASNDVNSVNTTIQITILAGAPTQVFAMVGDNQVGLNGAQLGSPLTVLVLDANFNSVDGVQVDWIVTAGGGTLSSAAVVTSGGGYASVRWTLAANASQQPSNTVTAVVDGTQISYTFSATGVP